MVFDTHQLNKPLSLLCLTAVCFSGTRFSTRCCGSIKEYPFKHDEEAIQYISANVTGTQGITERKNTALSPDLIFVSNFLQWRDIDDGL